MFEKDEEFIKEIEIETEHGIFESNSVLGKSAEEVYLKWLEDRNKPIELQLSEVEILRLEQAESNAEMFELILMLTGGML